MNVPRKYGLLRVIAIVLKVLAWLVLVAGIVGLVVTLSAVGGLTANAPQLRSAVTAGAFVVPIVAVVWFVQLFAFGSILTLLIDVEENTRALAAMPPA